MHWNADACCNHKLVIEYPECYRYDNPTEEQQSNHPAESECTVVNPLLPISSLETIQKKAKTPFAKFICYAVVIAIGVFRIATLFITVNSWQPSLLQWLQHDSDTMRRGFRLSSLLPDIFLDSRLRETLSFELFWGERGDNILEFMRLQE